MNKASFVTLRLSRDSVHKIRDLLPPKTVDSNPAWLFIGGKPWYEENRAEPLVVEKPVYSNLETDSDQKEKYFESKFFFTQSERPIFKEKVDADPILCLKDVIDSSIESLEHMNGKLDFLSFRNLSTDEISKVVEALKNNLSEKGVSNLCKSLSNMNTEQSLQFLPIVCSNVLLPKIIELEKDSIIIKTGIHDCAIKFPDEIQNYIFTGCLNSNLENTSIIMALVKTLGLQKYYSLLSDFANHTRELKQWHFSILETFSSIRPDENTRRKLLKLFSNKAVTFSKDKSYGKLIQTFAKTNAPFSDEEKLILEEIAALNQTVFKNLIEKFSKS